MTEESRIHPNYRGMLEIKRQMVADPAQATSATQAANAELDPGARWAQEATFRAYTTGGNEGDWDEEYHAPDPDVGPVQG